MFVHFEHIWEPLWFVWNINICGSLYFYVARDIYLQIAQE